MLFTEDATYYADLVKNKKISCLKLVEYAIDNAIKLQPILNCITITWFDKALCQAKKMDRQLQYLTEDERQKLPPFYGVPTLLKDLTEFWEGTVTSNGCALMRDKVSSRTDAYVQKVLEMGFLPIGRSNVSEFGLKTVADSNAFGAVCLPQDITRNPGGSSGGAAAAVKAGIVPIAMGSDAGGSIRVPAGYTGLIGLKPSRGRIASGPGIYRGFNSLSTQFALAKSVRDVFTMLKNASVYSPYAMCSLPTIKEEKIQSLTKPLKIAYSVQSLSDEPTSSDAIKAIKSIVSYLKAMGHEVIEDAPAIDIVKLFHFYYTTCLVETGRNLANFKDQSDRVLCKALGDLAWLSYKIGPQISAYEYSGMLKDQDILIEQNAKFYQNYDLFLTPTTISVAKKQTECALPQTLKNLLSNLQSMSIREQRDVAIQAFDNTYRWTPFTHLMNLTGDPAISLPVYETINGLPIGVQISSLKGNEYRLLQVAKDFEEHGLLKTHIVSL